MVAAVCTGMTTTSGHAPVGDLTIYYEVHGEPSPAGLPPLLLLHGGLFDIDLQFGGILPSLAVDRQVVAMDLQGHGGTNDTDRPLRRADLARDAVGLLDHLGIERVDVVGYSLGGWIAIELAVRHPARIRRLVASSAGYAAAGMRGTQNADAVGEMTVEMIAGTPMEATYLAKSPHPDREHLQTLLDKLGGVFAEPDFTAEQIRGIAAPTLVTVGDSDMVTLDHAVAFFRLRGGDVNGDFDGLPAAQLAVLPGTTHFGGYADPALVVAVLRPFLSVPD